MDRGVILLKNPVRAAQIVTKRHHFDRKHLGVVVRVHLAAYECESHTRAQPKQPKTIKEKESKKYSHDKYNHKFEEIFS